MGGVSAAKAPVVDRIVGIGAAAKPKEDAVVLMIDGECITLARRRAVAMRDAIGVALAILANAHPAQTEGYHGHGA